MRLRFTEGPHANRDRRRRRSWPQRHRQSRRGKGRVLRRTRSRGPRSPAIDRLSRSSTSSVRSARRDSRHGRADLGRPRRLRSRLLRVFAGLRTPRLVAATGTRSAAAGRRLLRSFAAGRLARPAAAAARRRHPQAEPDRLRGGRRRSQPILPRRADRERRRRGTHRPAANPARPRRLATAGPSTDIGSQRAPLRRPAGAEQAAVAGDRGAGPPWRADFFCPPPPSPGFAGGEGWGEGGRLRIPNFSGSLCPLSAPHPLSPRKAGGRGG